MLLSIHHHVYRLPTFRAPPRRRAQVLDSNAEIRAYLAADLRTKGIEDARAVLAQASPDGLDEMGRLAYWTEILQTELAAWDAETLTALLGRMPGEDQDNELLRPVIEAAKVVLDFVRSYPTPTTTEAE